MQGRIDAKQRLSNGVHAIRRAVPHHVWASLRDRLHPALRQRVASMLAPPRPSSGLVSVIVPCYNVEAYLGDCLESIIRQDYADLEIIVVIDGSPDRSGAIARAFARWDRRVRVIEQANRGLGAARNTGIRAATGDFIAFVDSDDTVPPLALSTMVRTLEESGSDFVVGGLERRDETRTWVPLWAQEVHRRDRIGITLDDHPEILTDVFAWNKLFRRDFFDRAVGAFPEGVRYEDQEPSAKAYSTARAFDVLHERVYTWYVRGDGTSITQQKSNLLDLSDRLAVMASVSEVLRDRADREVYRGWQAKSVGLDLRAYYNEVPRTGDDFWELLVSGVRAITKDMDQPAWAKLSVNDRLLARMVDQGLRDDLCGVLRRRSEVGDGFVLDLSSEPPQARPTYLDVLQSFAPTAQDLRLGPDDDRLRALLFGYDVVGRTAVVTGMAWVPGLDLNATETTLSAVLVDEIAGSSVILGVAAAEVPGIPELAGEIPLPVERFEDLVLDELVNTAEPSQARSGFRINLDLDTLASALEAAHPAVEDVVSDHPGWHIELVLSGAGRTWRGPFDSRDARWTAADLALTELVDGRRVVPLFSAARGLHFHLFAPRVAAEVVTLEGRELRLGVRTADAQPVDRVTITCGPLGLRRSFPAVPDPGDPSLHRATIMVPPLPPGAVPTKQYIWGIRASSGGTSRPLVHAGSTSSLTQIAPPGRPLRLGQVDAGRLRLLDRRTHVTVRDVEVAADRGSFTVRGDAVLPLAAPLALALVRGDQVWAPETTEHDRAHASYAAVFSVTATAWGQEQAPQYGGWSLRLLGTSDVVQDSMWIPIAPDSVQSVTPDFLHWHCGTKVAFRFTMTSRAKALWVNVRPPLAEKDWTRAGRWSLERGIPALLSAPLTDTVLFSTFGGRSAGDSPLAIYDELRRRGYGHRLVWEVADGATAKPKDAEAVVVGSPEHVSILHTARHLVSNNNFPFWYRKHPDQVYLQTWHGTPLKKIGRDVPRANLSLSYRDLMKREAAAWDLLLAQNDFAAQRLGPALEYDGEVLNVGYPRNDFLATAGPREAAVIRGVLGVPASRRLVLYAPTWRDNAMQAGGGYALVSYLDLDVVSRAFGEDSTLLVRGHSNTPGLGSALPHNVLDVSAYPDVAELMHVADVLITDYSSIMFDFVNTGRPMLFLTPDLAEYADSTRGFYLDFEAIAPGPLLSSTDEVLSSLASLAALRKTYASRYSSFAATFAPHDDGKAAARVVDHVWGAG